MNCEWVQQNVTLYVYDELADDARHELEQHLYRCPNCTAELGAMREFKQNLGAYPQLEVSPNLLTSARMDLQEALEGVQQASGWRRFLFDPTVWLRQMKFSPALAAVLLIVGFGGGIATMYQVNSEKPGGTNNGTNSGIQQEAAISGVKTITQSPNGQVQIQYDRTLPGSAQGSLDDPKVEQLLLLAARDNVNSGVRMDSIDLLKKKQADPQVRETLIFALRYDTNPGVRLKALEGLGDSVKDDIRVRNAVLEALLNDNNPGVRTGALHALEAVKADTSVRAALQQLAKDDPNQYIRSESRRVLSTLPQFD